jgi:hypothetical protein
MVNRSSDMPHLLLLIRIGITIEMVTKRKQLLIRYPVESGAGTALEIWREVAANCGLRLIRRRGSRQGRQRRCHNQAARHGRAGS